MGPSPVCTKRFKDKLDCLIRRLLWGYTIDLGLQRTQNDNNLKLLVRTLVKLVLVREVGQDSKKWA